MAVVTAVVIDVHRHLSDTNCQLQMLPLTHQSYSSPQADSNKVSDVSRALQIGALFQQGLGVNILVASSGSFASSTSSGNGTSTATSTSSASASKDQVATSGQSLTNTTGVATATAESNEFTLAAELTIPPEVPEVLPPPSSKSGSKSGQKAKKIKAAKTMKTKGKR